MLHFQPRCCTYMCLYVLCCVALRAAPFREPFVGRFVLLCVLFSYFKDRHAIFDGDVEGALSDADVVVEGEVTVREWGLQLMHVCVVGCCCCCS